MTNKNNEKHFEKQAKAIRDYLKSEFRYNEKFLPRPFFIEITGTPSAGKTTTITELDKFFRRMGFRVWIPQEGAQVIRHIERDTPVYNVRTGLYALQLLIDLSNGHQYDIVIFDRCVFDAYVWMMYWEDKSKLSAEEKELMQKFYTFREWVKKLDACYFMTCRPETAMRRELRIALTKKLGETTNPKTIRTLVKRYRRAYETLHKDHPQLFLLDTSRLKEQNMVDLVATKTLDILEQKTKTSA